MFLFNNSSKISYAGKVLLDDGNLGFLVTPRGIPKLSKTKGIFGVDNDCFNIKSYSEEKFLKLLEAVSKFENVKERCKFVNAPDVLNDFEETLKLYYNWYSIIKIKYNLPISIVLQDGANIDNIPWDYIDAIFVGGSTEFKLSENVRTIIKEAQLQKKWVHVGRVNTKRRLAYCKLLEVDSVDGSSFARFENATLPVFELINKCSDREMLKIYAEKIYKFK